MLKTMIAAGLAAATLSLAACNVPSTGNTQLDTLLNQAAAIAQQACGIEVVGVEIASMIPGVNVAGLTAVQIANQLCTSVLSRVSLAAPSGQQRQCASLRAVSLLTSRCVACASANDEDKFPQIA